MRELNLAEFESVSGGIGGPEPDDDGRYPRVVTIGQNRRSYEPWLYGGPSLPSTIIPIQLENLGAGSDQDDSDDNTDVIYCAELVEETQVDNLASFIGSQIADQPDWNSREYGAVIYRDSGGNISVTSLDRGLTAAEGGGQASVALNYPSGVEVLGFVHNHPDVGYSPTEDLELRNPSEGDWAVFNQFISDGNASADTLSMYIVDSDGIMREFHASDERRHTSEENPSTPDERNNPYNGQHGDNEECETGT
ncbi:MAG: hypothetical protein AAF296_13520 [Pseudomonadota bacterium]